MKSPAPCTPILDESVPATHGPAEFSESPHRAEQLYRISRPFEWQDASADALWDTQDTSSVRPVDLQR